MTDTAFEVADAKADRFANCYVKTDEDPLYGRWIPARAVRLARAGCASIRAAAA